MLGMNDSRFSSELIRSSTGLLILTLLRDRPMYGYEILMTLENRGNGDLKFKQGTLYPLLYRLKREGWLKPKWETPPQGKKRKVYSLTTAGRKVQRARLKEWHRFTKAVDSILQECNDE